MRAARPALPPASHLHAHACPLPPSLHPHMHVGESAGTHALDPPPPIPASRLARPPPAPASRQAGVTQGGDAERSCGGKEVALRVSFANFIFFSAHFLVRASAGAATTTAIACRARQAAAGLGRGPPANGAQQPPASAPPHHHHRTRRAIPGHRASSTAVAPPPLPHPIRPPGGVVRCLARHV